jgi:hypothetical protein
MRKIKNAIKTKSAQELAEVLNLDSSVAVEWELRYQITERIITKFNEGEHSITALARRAETSRARITNILKRDTQGISLDVLSRVLGSLGQTIKLKFLDAA